MLGVFVIFVVLMYFRDNKSNELILNTLNQQVQIDELTEFNRELLTENADLKVERATLNELEHEVEMFFDSSYIDNNTPDGVKDSILTDFFRQYDMLVGQRLREGSERADTTSGT